ncbi:unnamed protein product [Effrenium voratum]|uniref:chitin synthase n=1 Tax=Effrenium voratum TaxID=2562239 RepID=A0AA36IUC1_9DINO|nr:unnamed protein product [Effrenium voratum]CAJ1457562.1 unnamed protein product [Effrenium voratum]
MEVMDVQSNRAMAGGVLALAVATFVLVAWARVLLLRTKLARAKTPVAPSLLVKDLVDDVVREEELVVVLSCYRETQEELKHSLGTVGFQGGYSDLPRTLREGSASEAGPTVRVMIFLDGLQGKEEQVLQFLKASNEEDESSTQAPSSSGSSDGSSPRSEASPLAKADWGEDFATLQAMSGLLCLKNPERVHGCVRVQGELSSSSREVPFELYIKTSWARSKRASQALCMSLLQSAPKAPSDAESADVESGPRVSGPQALLLLDGDCRVEHCHLPELFYCLRDQKLAACGPFMLAQKRTSFCLLVQLVRDWASQRILWLGQSVFRFQAPLNGSCAMYSMEAVQAVQEHFCRAVREDSMLDNMRIEMGEDSFMTNLVHEHVQERVHGVHGIRFMPQVHASSFMPETWLEYLAQQCRWKRSHLGNRSALLLNPKVWCCKPSRWPFWLVHVASFLWTPHLAPATLTLWFSHLTGEFLEDAGLGRGLGAGVHAALWLVICLYAVLSAGSSVPSKPKMHSAFMGFFMGLGALQMFLLAHRNLCFVAMPLAMSVVLLLLQLPHGLRAPWAGLLVLAVPLAAFVELVQQPVVAVANADGVSAKWATREKTEGKMPEAKVAVEDWRKHAMAIRSWSRWIFLTAWLFVNFALGAVPLSLGYSGLAGSMVASMLVTNLLLHALLALAYSLWLAFFRARRACGA